MMEHEDKFQASGESESSLEFEVVDLINPY